MGGDYNYESYNEEVYCIIKTGMGSIKKNIITKQCYIFVQ